jgi:hypothetical protein
MHPNQTGLGIVIFFVIARHTVLTATDKAQNNRAGKYLLVAVHHT